VIGGVVFPPHHYAGIHNMIAQQLAKYMGEWGNIYTDRSAKDNLLEIVTQIHCIGINVLVLYSGHYPPCQVDMLQDIAREFDHSKSFRVIPFYESMILQGDHAGISETSFMLYLDDDLVDLTRISPQNYRDHGWQEHNSPERATVEKGEADVARVIQHLKCEITAALGRL
jgi:creatinine amidohydrolase/Fe(II)-dependent formamide hydrolase-like protein